MIVKKEINVRFQNDIEEAGSVAYEIVNILEIGIDSRDKDLPLEIVSESMFNVVILVQAWSSAKVKKDKIFKVGYIGVMTKEEI